MFLEVSIRCHGEEDVSMRSANKFLHAGNQYSIENELDKPAKIFFSQACEPAPMMVGE
jgi:hypothetical protein